MSTVLTRTVAPATGGYAMYAFLTALVAQGWNRKSDSDGTTYDPAGAKLTHGGSGAKGLGNANAWFRVQGAAGGPFEWCIQRGADNTQWRIKSALNAFTGGSPGATQTPSAAGEVIRLGGGTDASPTFATLFPADATYLVDALVQDANGPPPGAYNCALITYTFLGAGDAYSILAKDDDPAYGFGGAAVRCAVGAVWLRKLSTALINVGGIAPGVTWISPAVGGVLYRRDSVHFQITTLAGGTFAALVVIAEFPSGVWEVVHDGTSFAAGYSGSVRSAITDGFDFVVTRLAGWPQTPSFRIIGVDTAGNVNA
jgi:hypothetical protein